MFEIDERDKLIEIRDLPQSSIGAPIPMIACSEQTLNLAYYIEDVPDDWDGSSVRVVGLDPTDETVALLRFELCYAHMFGPPNNEAYTRHPLADRGLKPYSAFEVKNSSWIHQAERRNAVHPCHKAERFFENKRHFILIFHDSTYECIAKSFTVKLIKGSTKGVLCDAIKDI